MRSFKSQIAVVAIAALVSCPFVVAEEIVVQDGDATLSYEEMAYSVEHWTPQMRNAASKDEGDRLELINLVLANKKVAHEIDSVLAEHPDMEQEYRQGMEAYQRNFVLRAYRDNLELPDFTKLAKEQYTVDRDKYALVPERRLASHILIASPPGVPRDDALKEASEVLAELRNGADFVEMVKEHSDEPGAAAKGGQFNKWIKYGEVGVSPPFSEGVFSIARIGEYSEPVQTEFGVHIIRLDGIKEKSYKTFDEVKDNIIKELKDEYVKLAMKEYVSRFQMSPDAIVDDGAMKKILAPYAETE